MPKDCASVVGRGDSYRWYFITSLETFEWLKVRTPSDQANEREMELAS